MGTFLRLGRHLPCLASLTIACGSAQAMNLVLNDPRPDYYEAEDPCKRSSHNTDRCEVRAHLFVGEENVQSNAQELFRGAWDNWNAEQSSPWTLVDGGDLHGTMSISVFRAYNDCFETGGVEVEAKFTPAGNDPTNLCFAQGVLANWTTSSRNHADDPGPYQRLMDVKPAGPMKPPLYPYCKEPGRFYDKPGTHCLHNARLTFDASCLLASANYDTRTLTTYRGFRYGFVFECRHTVVPEPAVLAGFGCGMVLLTCRRWQSIGRN